MDSNTATARSQPSPNNRQAVAVLVGLLSVAATIVIIGVLSGGGDDVAIVALPTPAAESAEPAASSHVPVPELAPTSVAPAPTSTPTADPATPTPTFIRALIATPEGHESMVLEVPFARALGGNVRAGERVALIASTAPLSDKTSSVVVLDGVEILGVAPSIDVGTPQDVSLTIAVTPDEATIVTGAVATGEITIVGTLSPQGYHMVAIEMPADRALDGKVRPGDLVSIVVGADVAVEAVEVLSLSLTISDDTVGVGPATASLIVAALPNDLTTVAAAISSDELSIARP